MDKMEPGPPWAKGAACPRPIAMGTKFALRLTGASRALSDGRP